MEPSSRMERKRDERKDAIAAAAEGLFLSKGYLNTSMNDIAEAADLTKKTLYAYFSSKEDIYYAIVARWYGNLLEDVVRVSGSGGTAYERVLAGCDAYARLYRKNPVLFALMNDLEKVRRTANEGSLVQKKRLAAVKKELFARMSALFDEGKRDGSIRGDLPTQTLVASFIFDLTGFFYILSSNGMGFTRYFKINMNDFVATSVGLIAESLKAR